MADPIYIIIPAWNQASFSRQCIRSLQEHTSPESYRLILVDNGSTDDTAVLFDAVPDAEVIHLPENRGFAAAVNEGIRRVQAGHVLLLNNDTLLPPGWLERLHVVLDEMPDAGMVGPVSNRVSGLQQVDTPSFTSYDDIAAFAEQRAREYAGRRRETARLVGFCLLIRDQVIQDIGLFDEQYGIGNYEDDDYCIRVLRAGWRLVIAEDAFVFHYGGQTFSALSPNPEDYNQLMARNEALFLAKFQPLPHERISEALQARRLAETALRHLNAGNLRQAIETGLAAIQCWPAEWLALDVLARAMDQLGDRRRADQLRKQAEAARALLEHLPQPSSGPDTQQNETKNRNRAL